MREILIVVSLCAVCIAAAVIFRRRRLARQAPPLGMVLLLSRTRPLQASTLTKDKHGLSMFIFFPYTRSVSLPRAEKDQTSGAPLLGKH